MRERDQSSGAEISIRNLIALHPSIEIWRSALTLILFESGQTQAALRELQAAEDRGLGRVPRDGHWALTLSCYAIVATELRVESAAETIHGLLTPVAHQHITAMMTARYQGTVRRLLGYLEASLGRIEPAYKTSNSRSLRREQRARASQPRMRRSGWRRS